MTIDDLGYVDKVTGKKSAKGPFTSSEGYKKCEKLLANLKKHPSAAHFLNLSVLPGYAEAVKEPMDLNTLEKKLKTGVYTSSGQFAADAKKIWNNSWQLNLPGTDFYIATTEISNYFEKLMKDIGEIPFISEENFEIQELRKNVNKAANAVKQITSAANTRTPNRPPSTKNAAERPMSTQEKAQLKQNIMQLTQDKLQGVIQIIQSAVDTSKSKETLEFDIDKLPIRVCRELDQYVKKHVAQSKKPGKKKPSPKNKKEEAPQSEVRRML